MGRDPHAGAPAEELRASLEGCVLADGSRWMRLDATGPDFLGLLHRLSTGEVAGLEPGRGAVTILTTPKGRIVERLFVHRLRSGVLSVGGVGRATAVLEHLARYTFAEQTGLTDLTAKTFQLLLVGPRAGAALDAAGLTRPDPLAATAGTLGGVEVQLLGQDGLSADGFSVVGPVDSTATVRESLLAAVLECGGRAAGDEAIEARRILRGLPAPGHELTGDYNPLEAGQWNAVSFDKGCYVGQEVVARLRTYDKVSRELVGLRFAEGAAPEAGVELLAGSAAVGRVTSVCRPPDRDHAIGLGYVKKKALGSERELVAGGVRCALVALPFF